MKVAAYLLTTSCAILAFPVLADVRPDVLTRPFGLDEGAKDRAVLERRYKLPMAQAEALAIALRLELPRDTKVKTVADENGTFLILNAPKKVHDPVAALVALFASERLEKQNEKRESMRRQSAVTRKRLMEKHKAK